MHLAFRFANTTFRRAARAPFRIQLPASAAMAQARWIKSAPTTRTYHSSMGMRSIMPDSQDPPPKESEGHDQPVVPSNISTEEYHERADQYLNDLVEKLEQAQSEDPEVDVEYSAGVLEVTFKQQKFVLNKQPPNKQIWLSSPVSGPKRYDWVVVQEGINFKEGGGMGDWIYLRDKSSLTELLKRELSVDVGLDKEAPC